MVESNYWKPFVVKDDENNVHILNFKENGKYHFKASLYDLLPVQIIESNKDKNESLVFGFIKQFEAIIEIMYFSDDLKRLIVKFLTVFI